MEPQDKHQQDSKPPSSEKADALPQQLLDLVRLFPHTPLIPQDNFTPEQLVELRQHLTNPLVQAYFQELANNTMFDMLKLNFDDVSKGFGIAAKHNYCRGMLDICITITNLTRE